VYESETDAMMCFDHSICHGGVEEFTRFVEYLETRGTEIPVGAKPGMEGVKSAVAAAREKGLFVLGWGDVVYPGSSPFLTLFLMAMREEPKLIQRYMEITTEGAISFVKAQIKAGVDGILGGNDWCFNSGPMFSLKDFQTFFVPYLRRIVDVCHHNRVPYIKHLDGNTTILLKSLVEEVGIDGYHSIEPAAGMDIKSLKQEYGDKITLMGNLDCGELLTNGSPDEVAEQTRWIIRNISPGGGHVFGSSNSIHDAVSLENLHAMLQTAYEYGQYPINQSL
jgi:uroporphyrinogen-III decarboxylase